MRSPALFLLPFLMGSSLDVSGAAPMSREASPTPSSEILARLSEDYWDVVMRLNPLNATTFGYARYHNRLDDNSAAGRAEEERDLRKILARLKTIDRSMISESDGISWDIIELLINERLEGIQRKLWQWDVHFILGPHVMIPWTIEMSQPMKTEEDAKALIERIEAMPEYFANQTQNLREGLSEGRITVRSPLERTIRQLADAESIPPERTAYAVAANRLPEPIRKEYFPKILHAVETSVYPPFKKYHRFLESQYLPLARPDETPGIWKLPQGAETYRYLIRAYTGLDKSPEEIHAIGLEELRSLHVEMEAIARKRGHAGDLKSFFESLRRDPRNFFSTREEILELNEEFLKKAQARLPQYFNILPKTAMIIKPSPEYREKEDVAGAYYSPPDDLSRPGTYTVNTYDPPARSRLSMEALAVHEGDPGHHLQSTIALDRRDLPAFRRNGAMFGMFSHAFVEGWAHYSERLADEMGLYTDDLARLGMLSGQSLRACRLVVDTGLHAMRWDRQRAIQFMKDNLVLSEDEITVEVDRYIIWPGQALAYKIGQKEIEAIRRESQNRLGSKFDIRVFHDAVLKNGAVPLSILRRSVLGR